MVRPMLLLIQRFNKSSMCALYAFCCIFDKLTNCRERFFWVVSINRSEITPSIEEISPRAILISLRASSNSLFDSDKSKPLSANFSSSFVILILLYLPSLLSYQARHLIFCDSFYISFDSIFCFFRVFLSSQLFFPQLFLSHQRLSFSSSFVS